VNVMKTIGQAFKLFLILTVITGIAYPLLITILGQAIFPNKANGSLIRAAGKTIGSTLLGQKFTKNEYFWSRSSAIDYNPLPSGGSNLGPTSLALKDSVLARKDLQEKANPGSGKVPGDLLFASASGLDPDISPDAARFQINRVALARGLDNEGKKQLIELVEKHIEQPDFGIFGEPRVNVLLLNLAIDSTFMDNGHER
jgi:potassium-transporting ATPase KdpC subunit